MIIYLVLLCAAGPLYARQAAQQQGTRPLVFGFLPILSAERLVTRFSPLVDYLARHSDLDIRMETAPDFSEFLKRTQTARRYDLLFTAPHFFYLAERERGYSALARVDRPGMTAVVVTPADSDIHLLTDLRGRSLATTGPLALSTLLIRDLLEGAGLDPDHDMRLVATPSHIAALLSSQQGTTDASGVMSPVFRHTLPQIRDTMRTVAETGPVPHIPIGAAPWVDSEVAGRLQAILIGMRNDPEGRAVLAQLGWPGFVAVQPHEYDSLRSLAEQVRPE